MFFFYNLGIPFELSPPGTGGLLWRLGTSGEGVSGDRLGFPPGRGLPGSADDPKSALQKAASKSHASAACRQFGRELHASFFRFTLSRIKCQPAQN